MPATPRPPQRYTLDQWKEIVADFQKSGLSRTPYCKLKGIHPASFSLWKERVLSPDYVKKPNRPRRGSTPEQWKEIIKDWQTSGLPQETYCKKNDLTLSSFYRWKNRILSPNSSQNISPSTAKNALYTLIEYGQEQWKEIIKDWQTSGLPTRIYCLQKNFSRTTFNRWKKKLLNPQDSSQMPSDLTENTGPQNKAKPTLEEYFIPATIMDGESSKASSSDQQPLSQQKIEVIFAQGHRLHVYGSVNWDSLQSWLTPLLQNAGRQE